MQIYLKTKKEKAANEDEKDIVSVLGLKDGSGKSYVDPELIPQNVSFDEQMDFVALQAIWKMRKYAIDHESHLPDHNGEHFHGAALVRTSKGRYFLTANIQMSDDHTHRSCAEKRGLEQSKENRVRGEQITDIWFTGGLGNFHDLRDDKDAISPGQEGRYPTPCCACLSSLFDENKAMRVHLLPLMEPRAGLNLKRHDMDAAFPPKHAVFETTVRDLYGIKKIVVTEPAQKVKLSKVIGYLNKPLAQTRKEKHIAQTFQRMHVQFNSAVKPRKIADLFMNQLRFINQMPGARLRFAEIAFVQTGKKEGYLATSFINDMTPASAPALSKAAQGATHNQIKGNVTRVFYTSVDMRKLKQLEKAANMNSFPDISFKMPGGNGIERVRKASVFYGDTTSDPEIVSQDIPVTYILPNIPDDFDVEADTFTFNLGDVVKKPWSGSKVVKEQRKNGNGAHNGNGLNLS